MTAKLDNLVWIDLEMTGLNPDTDHIIEIATIVTDAQLNVLAEGPVVAIHQPEPVLAAMDDWNRRTHGESGLVERVRRSPFSAMDAESQTLEFLQLYAESGASPMCGNSICQDRRFLARRRWAPDVLAGLQKTSKHLALDDIRESIEELRYYRATLFAK